VITGVEQVGGIFLLGWADKLGTEGQVHGFLKGG